MSERKTALLIVLLTLLVGSAFLYIYSGHNLINVSTMEYEKEAIIKTGDGKTYEFEVELALTYAAVNKGLMYRQTLDERSGMLFLFGKSEPRMFWMKNTLIPLDIIFIKEGGRIHHIHKNAVPLDETPISSQGDVIAVLEINGGLTSELGIKPGDTVIHSALP